mmetsp:Transcript_10536/g.32233  ORF Transcript_10536/g.32233 Transcript_10536/m.32233 type:complete len:308 (+) Transcript_10536:139-1062(+)|eukprot:CAMPEP_0198730382 /NCGR_PEP_ID=MMETSP1475-20131203/24313_1 /TAXON_ID= ORGANISM="Unidentified sp., Strain CCMP1999" /NCGR_SAMPLE_ID=MMETSP1475 /ASSEMBLY_ACC=CAM_ASM_001111 /LENGTH=307 /DNA_ID=CAMNT_0044493179 /DNA_START=92 /DNA_END=1015 /DNA_ORIENTATION=+
MALVPYNPMEQAIRRADYDAVQVIASESTAQIYFKIFGQTAPQVALGVAYCERRRAGPRVDPYRMRRLEDITLLLLEYGVDLPRTEFFAEGEFIAPLGAACFLHFERLVRRLLCEFGWNPNEISGAHRTNPLGFLAMDPSWRGKDLSIRKMLLQAGANPNFRNSKGETPLHLQGRWATRDSLGSLAAFRLMLLYGADVRIRNNAGETAADIFKARQADDILENLINAGESIYGAVSQKLPASPQSGFDDCSWRCHTDNFPLPDEVLVKILSHLTPLEILRGVRPTCTKMHELSRDRDLWNRVLVKRA